MRQFVGNGWSLSGLRRPRRDLSVTLVALFYERNYITERRIITSDQVEVMLPTSGPTTTLISCYLYLIDTHRIVLFGELVE